MNDTRTLRDLILDQCDAKGIHLGEVAKKTGLPEQYLDAIINNVRTRLPAFPYVRIHLVRLAELLGLSPEVLLQKYRDEFSEKRSGAADALPGNRFALPSGRRRYLIGAGVAVIILIAYFMSTSGVFGRPHITISMPPAGVDPFITSSSTILLSGSVEAGSSVLINGQAIASDESGQFTYEYHLLPEINIIEFTAKRFLGGQAALTRQVYYEEPPGTTARVKPAAVPVGEASAQEVLIDASGSEQ